MCIQLSQSNRFITTFEYYSVPYSQLTVIEQNARLIFTSSCEPGCGSAYSEALTKIVHLA